MYICVLLCFNKDNIIEPKKAKQVMLIQLTCVAHLHSTIDRQVADCTHQSTTPNTGKNRRSRETAKKAENV